MAKSRHFEFLTKLNNYQPPVELDLRNLTQADHLSIENYVTHCTLFCDYCEILRNKHVGLFKIGLNWT